MKRFFPIFLAVFFAAMPVHVALAHPGGHHHHHDDDAPKHANKPVVSTLTIAQADAAAPAAATGVTGQDDFKFKLLYASDHLPAEAIAVLVNAHGGFAVDRREGKGAIYFALPGAGIIEISPDLKTTRLINTPQEMKETNLHNAGIWYGPDDSAFLVFPGNSVGKVYTTTLDGSLINTLEAPTAETDFDEATVNKYFDEGGKFVPTDVAKLGRYYYITTGYSNLDYVLTATVNRNAERVEWNDLVFGGRGTGVGQFGTGHGVTISPDSKRVTIADRPNAEIDRFTRYGHYRDTVKLPEGSLACDIDYAEGYAIIGCLEGPDKAKGAPIYILKDDKIISTLMPKEDLGLANFTHIHNATFTKIGDTWYVIAQAWNPGDFAILEQVKE